MALFPQHANGSGDNLLWMKFNELVTLLNRWSAKIALSVGNTLAETKTLLGMVSTTAFTPSVKGSGTAGTWTYTTRTGYYSVNGSQCFIYIRLKIASVAGSPTGSIVIYDLPKVADANATGMFTVMSAGLDWGAGHTQIVGFVRNSEAALNLYGTTNNGAWVNIAVGGLLATDDIILYGSYFI